MPQVALAARCSLHVETIIGLEGGHGTMASLTKALSALGQRPSVHYDPSRTLGQHLDDHRRKLGLSHARLAMLGGVSRPSVAQVLRDSGRVETLAAVLAAMHLPFKLVPSETSLELMVARPRSSVRRVIEGDCRVAMRDLEPGSIDLAVTSPPYMSGKIYEDPLTIDEYAAFAASWVSHLPRLLTRRGAAWINLGFAMTEHGEALPLTYLVYPIARRHGLKLVQEVIWHYEGGLRYTSRFAHRTERWMWLVRDPADYEFRLDHVRDPRANRTRDARNHPLGKNPTDYWYYDRVVGGRGAGPDKTSHPCQLPVPMVERIVQACSRVGDTILDPFAGSGSVAVAADRLGRGYVAIERDGGYVAEMRERLALL